MRRFTLVSTMAAGLVLWFVSSASAQLPMPPVPPFPPGADPLHLLDDVPEQNVDLPQCRGLRTCSVGPKQLRCRKAATEYDVDRSCALQVAGAVAECTDHTESYHGLRYHRRICRVAVGDRTIARCEETYSAYIDYSRYRSCSVAAVAYTCSKPFGYPPVKEHCALTGLPRPPR